MKTIFKVAMLSASAFFVLSSCLKEQSSLQLEDIPGQAVITGTVMLYEGTDYVDGAYVSLKSPAIDKEIIVKVDNGSYLTGTPNETYTDYKAKTNEEGYFEVNIPATDNTVFYKIMAPSIVGEFSRVKGAENGEIVLEKVEGVYNVDNSAVYSTTAGAIERKYVEYVHTPAEKGWAFKTTAVLHAYVGKGWPSSTEVKEKEIRDGVASYRYNGEVAVAEKVNLILDVTYQDSKYSDANGDQHKERLVVTSDEDGFAEFKIPVEEVADHFTLSISAEEHLGTEDFTYYTWVTNVDDNLKSKEGACSIAAGDYTFAYYDSDIKPSYDFRFFTPVVKVVMKIKQINADEGIITSVDNNNDNNDNFEAQNVMYFSDLSYNYVSFWDVEDFKIDE